MTTKDMKELYEWNITNRLGGKSRFTEERTKEIQELAADVVSNYCDTKLMEYKRNLKDND